MEWDAVLEPDRLIFVEIELHIGHSEKVTSEDNVVARWRVKYICFNHCETPGVAEFGQGEVVDVHKSEGFEDTLCCAKGSPFVVSVDKRVTKECSFPDHNV